ncbi:rhomboid family intramembrane serine protease [Candidatus Woesearchaeota archaeon]|nr:rhomboid family intramembrane serine protease [Candidatus Woesearchaeota archaeon]
MARNNRFSWWALKLAAICIGAFMLQKISATVTSEFMMNSSEVLYRPWILLTSIFLHGSFVHLAYNMFALALFGLILEKKVGSRNFLWLFFIGGVFANIATLPFYSSSLGASGAVYTILGMLAVLRPKMVIWISYIPMRMWLAAVAWAIGNLIIALAPTNIGAVAHLSGMAFGIIAGFYWRQKRKTRKRNNKKSYPEMQVPN